MIQSSSHLPISLRRSVRAGLLALCVTAAACQPAYKYGNVNYPTAEAGLAAARADVDGVLAPIHQSSTRVGGTVAVIVPSVSRARDRGVVKTGNPSPEQIDYVAKTLVLGWSGMGSAVDRAGIFDTVTIVEDDDPEVASSTADWTIWMNLVEPNTAGWYLRKRGGEGREPLPIDTGVQPKDRAAAWAESVGKTASRLAGAGEVSNATSRTAK